MNPRSQVGQIREFKCTSSIIFLTHPGFIESVKNTFRIKEIFNIKKESLWSFKTDPSQNITNKPMQTLHIVLQLPVRIQDIETTLKRYNFINSLSDVVAVEKQDEISKVDATILMNVLPSLDQGSKKGEKYAVPENLLGQVPEGNGIEKIIYRFNKKIALFTEDGRPIALVLEEYNALN